jgi:hypothetical protein
MGATCHKRSPKKSGFKITKEQREELVKLWLAGGQQAVAAKQREYGVADKYASNQASIMGIHRCDMITRSDVDPRWVWAIERGPVLA